MAVFQRNPREATKLIEDRDIVFTGTVDFTSTTSGVARSELDEDSNATYTLRPEDWKIWDDMDSPLPSTPAADNLGIIDGTFGTGSPSIQTEDLKSAGATSSYARRTFALPPEYVSGGTITVRLHAGMLTTVADTSSTLDVECYLSDEEAGIGSDICATAAQSINSVVLADKDFTITPTGLAAGDLLDIRITTAVNDGATATVVKAIIGAAQMLLDIKG